MKPYSVHYIIPTVVFLVILSAVNGFAQAAVEWMRFYEGSSAFADIYPLTEGGYAAVGSNSVHWVVSSINEEGDVEWFNEYNREESGYLKSIVETDNCDLLAGGALNNNFTVSRISSEGEIIWLRSYGAGVCNVVLELKNGNFALAGVSGDAARLLIVNGDGQIMVDRSHRNDVRAIFYSMREREEGLVLLGQSANENNVVHAWMMRLNLDGEQEWLQDYIDPVYYSSSWNSLVSSEAGGFAFYAGVNSNQRVRPVVTATDANGNIEWWTHWDDLRVDPTAALMQLPGIGYFMFGRNRDDNRPMGICIDTEGEELWRAIYRENVMGEFYPYGIHSVVRSGNGDIVGAGEGFDSAGNNTSRGLIIKIEGIAWEPRVLRWSPFDTIQTVLQGNSIEFNVEARDQFGREVTYAYYIADSLVNDENRAVVQFDSNGVTSIECRITAEESVSRITWHVTVTDLFIASHSPDALSLSLRRGTSQTFSLDTVRAVEGDPVQYQWTLTNLDNFEREDAGMESRSTVEFLRSGNHQMEGLAYRGESWDNVIWTIAVRSAILDFWPRELNLSVPPDSSGEFGVLPFNPESDSLSYRWEVDGDSVGSDSTISLSFAWNGQAGRSIYAVSAIVMDGAEGDTVTWEVTVKESDQVGRSESQKVENWGLLKVSPNPFNSSTTIRYTTSGDAYPTRLTVHDLTGREVRECVSAEVQAGEYSYILNGTDLPAGVYLVRLDIAGSQVIRKVVLLR